MSDSNWADDDNFGRELVALIPFMRALARGLVHDRAEADDLVQEALVKAWGARNSFQPGTSMKAWLATILRNYFRQTRRTTWRLSQLDQQVAEQTLVARDDPSAPLALDDVRRALYALPLFQREVLMLVAGGFNYDEVAQICGCEVGTVKSRVSRGRAALHHLIDHGRPPRDSTRASEAMDAVIRGMSDAADAAGKAQ